MDNLENITASFLKLLSDPLRLSIIGYLKDNPSSISQIQEDFNLSQSYVSHQLKKLVTAGLIEYVREGKNKIAHIKNENIHKLIGIIKSYVIHLEKQKIQNIANLEKQESIEDFGNFF
ncbi:MAG: ArsR family transcriptional regulator [Promethearchaeota archaeon]|nr:MAG: ArsR family transcriptional regulator [Candidatus Lokiarchaeota archaeon]